MIAQLKQLVILTAAVFCFGVAILTLDTLSEFVTVYRAAIYHVLFVAFKCVLFCAFALCLVLIEHLRTPLPSQNSDFDDKTEYFDRFGVEQGGAADLTELFDKQYEER